MDRPAGRRPHLDCPSNPHGLLFTYRYLTGNERHPLIIYGAEGSGKTCLLARAAQQCHSWQQPDLECGLEMGVILRFARLTPGSGSVLTMLHSLTQQVSLLATGRLPRNPHVTRYYYQLVFLIA